MSETRDATGVQNWKLETGNSRLSRRRFLQAGGLTGAALTLAACSAAGRFVAEEQLPEALAMPAGAATPTHALLVRLLNRAGYGPRPGDLNAALEVGFEHWLEAQLHPENIDDTAADLMLRGMAYYHQEIGALVNADRRDVTHELGRATVSRAIWSKRQLEQAMVEFWSDHFNIYLRKADIMPFLKTVDDRDVIRPHALGNFRDLLLASARSPAMLVYLDNVRNVARAPNENYAREIMELHTLGVNGGYTQTDVEELARAFTGWGFARRGRKQGQFVFHEDEHDPGEKIVLGKTLPAGRGEQDVLDVIDVLVAHPSTATFIATKLVRRFVADDPPASLVERVAQTYTDSGGAIKPMLRTLFLSDEFANAPPKLKRPYTYMVSALRALGADIGNDAWEPLPRFLGMMGQPLFQWPPPDGYPDTAEPWATNLLPRWNFGMALVSGRMPGIEAPLDKLAEAGDVSTVEAALDTMSLLTLGGPMDAESRGLFMDYIQQRVRVRPNMEEGRPLREVLSLLLASPAFQWT